MDHMVQLIKEEGKQKSVHERTRMRIFGPHMALGYSDWNAAESFIAVRDGWSLGRRELDSIRREITDRNTFFLCPLFYLSLDVTAYRLSSASLE